MLFENVNIAAESVNRTKIITVVIDLMFFLGLILLYAYPPDIYGFYPRCLWHEITGTYCPGCGSLRSFNALVKGDIFRVTDYNKAAIFYIPFLIYIFINIHYISLTGKSLPTLKLNAAMLYSLAGLIIVYWVIRNIIPYFAPANT